LAELQLKFDSSADAYRAQMGRWLSSGTVATGEQQAIRDVLARLAEAGA
jgi:hypothetical protein